jgi:multiple sugar transport system ATP-binding protein
MAQLELHGVTKRFGAITAVEDIDITVPDNEFFCIFGPPGCGKTTLLRLWLGLDTPDEGTVVIDGREVTRHPPAERNLSMVFQNLALFPHMTVAGNLRFPLVERKMPRDEIAQRVAKIADTLHITPLLNKMPAHLSGGERQRVAIGRSLVRDPAAYLMDEPISALDARLREEMRVELSRLQRELKHTLVYVTHDQEEAMSVADRICIMENGRVVQTGTANEIYNRPETRYVAEFVGAPPINLIEGRFENGHFVAPEPSLRVAVADAGGQRDGSATIGVRPEDVRIGREGATGAIAAKVYQIEPLGAVTIVNIMAGERVIRAQIPGQPKFKLGDPVFVTLDLRRCHFFEGDTGHRFATGVVTDGG